MTLIVEDSSGVKGANSYVDVVEVTNYLTARGREAENSWDSLTAAQQEAAAIKATDYIEKRFSERFLGQKLHRSIDYARTVLTFTQNAGVGEQVVLGSVTYTFQSALSSANDVLIGDSASASLDNLLLAVGDDPANEGEKFGTGTVANEDVTAGRLSGDRLVIVAKEAGTAGNGVTTTTTVTGAEFSFATTRGGDDTGEPQPLSFPRRNLYDRDGRLVVGIPRRLKEAVAEYAIRAVAAALAPDPTFDATGQPVIRSRNKVGPIETEVEYQDGGKTQALRAYPAADALLTAYLLPTGTVFR